MGRKIDRLRDASRTRGPVRMLGRRAATRVAPFGGYRFERGNGGDRDTIDHRRNRRARPDDAVDRALGRYSIKRGLLDRRGIRGLGVRAAFVRYGDEGWGILSRL